MRILHIINHTLLLNGNVNVAIDLACTQARMGQTVAIASGGGVFDQVLKNYGVEHIIIDQSRDVSTILKAIYKLRLTVKRFQPDIIHAHMMTGAVLASMLRPFMNFKLVTTVHNEFEKAATWMGVGDGVVAVSQAVAASMERRGVAKSKLRVIINGVIHSPRLGQDLPAAEKLLHPAVIFVGGLHPRKGVSDLIEAFNSTVRKIPNAHLYLVGAGPYEQAYRDQVTQAGIEASVMFCGPQDDPRSYLLGADLFVLASLAEPGGLVLTEARNAGCAVIATSVGGNPEMLDNGKAGLLVPVQRPDLLAESMIKVLSDDQELTLLKQRSRQNLECFTVDRAAQDYLSHYEELLTGVSSPRMISFRGTQPSTS